jgi:hypothetical protein
MSFSDFLIARGGFLSGIARSLGGGGSLYNYAATPTQADLLALYADWRTVGEDMRHAFQHAAQEVADRQLTLFDLHGT